MVIAIALVTVFLSFFLTFLEAILLNLDYHYIEEKIKTETAFGLKLRSYKDKLEIPLLGILIGQVAIRAVGLLLLGGWLVFSGLPLVLSLLFGVLIVGLLLVVSEVVPRVMATTRWEKLIPLSMRILETLLWLTLPLIRALQALGDKVGKGKDTRIFSHTDLSRMIEANVPETVEDEKTKLLRNFIEFDKRFVQEIMTPRTVVKAAAQDETIKDFFEKNSNLSVSRIPIYDEHIDNVKGYVLKAELLTKLIHNEGDEKLETIRRNILIVNERTTIPKLFQKLLKQKEHIALVVDEFGAMEGVVTMEDIFEDLIGVEIIDEYDDVEDMQDLARKNWEEKRKDLGIDED